MLCGLWGERTIEKVKLLRQFLVIMAVSFVGEILHAVLPLPIPASIYGLVLMLALLMTGGPRCENENQHSVLLRQNGDIDLMLQ